MPRTQFTADERRIFSEPVFVHVATLMPDGSPQVSAMWVEMDGDDILLNSLEGRVKPRNLRRDGRVALSVLDPADPYHNVSIRGRVVEITNAGAEEGIDRLARKYIGTENYPFRQPGERRVQFRVRPESIGGQAGERPRAEPGAG